MSGCHGIFAPPMPSHETALLPRAGVLRTTHLVWLAFCLAVALFAAAPRERTGMTFDIPAGPAEKAIGEFSAQSGFEVLYPSSVIKGLRTPAVKGRMTPREALDALVAGSGLTVVHDEKSGAFALKRAADRSHSPAGSRG